MKKHQVKDIAWCVFDIAEGVGFSGFDIPIRTCFLYELFQLEMLGHEDSRESASVGDDNMLGLSRGHKVSNWCWDDVNHVEMCHWKYNFCEYITLGIFAFELQWNKIEAGCIHLHAGQVE